MEELGKALLGLGAAGPICALLFWLWWTERQERRELAGKLLDHAVAATTAARDMTVALNALAEKVVR